MVPRIRIIIKLLHPRLLGHVSNFLLGNDYNDNNSNNNGRFKRLTSDIFPGECEQKLLWDFEIQTDPLISARRPDPIIIIIITNLSRRARCPNSGNLRYKKKICPWERDAQTLGFWDTNGSPNLSQTTRPSNNNNNKSVQENEKHTLGDFEIQKKMFCWTRCTNSGILRYKRIPKSQPDDQTK